MNETPTNPVAMNPVAMNPVMVQVVWSRLLSICDEQQAALIRSAFPTVCANPRISLAGCSTPAATCSPSR